MTDLPRINSKEWVKAAYRPMPLIKAFDICRGTVHSEFYRKKIGVEALMPHIIHVKGEWYLNKKELEEFNFKIGSFLSSDPRLILNMIKQCEKDAEIFINHSKKVNDVESLRKWFELAYEFTAFAFVVYGDKPIEIKLKAIMQHYFPDDNELYNIVSTPIKENLILVEKRELLELLSNGQEDKLKGHFEKYLWISTAGFYQEPWTWEDFLDRIEKIKNKGAKKLLEEYNQSRAEQIKKFNDILANVDEDSAKFIESVNYYIYFRTFRTDVHHISSHTLGKFLNKHATQNGMELNQIFHLIPEDIIDFVEGYFTETIKQKSLKAREKCAVVASSKGISVYTGNEAEKLYQSFQEDCSNITELKGETANKGIVKGKVRIIGPQDDIKEMQKGEILVASMTSPRHIVAMEKASAFVTDEGGITCHAAILSREMGKPCIIATQNATKVLKTGDMIEVNADKGTVKILGKTEKAQAKLAKTFKEITKDDAGIAGGKGASLGEMTKAGIPVPPGFVVLADAFENFISSNKLGEKIDLIISNLNPKDITQVQNASDEIKSLILNAEMHESTASEIKSSFRQLDTPYVAVRSSATAEDSSEAAWAGQLDSYLNTTASTLLENVKKCWASLFTPRAIVYRFEKNLQKKKISVAVVVQKMVDSRASGIGFSVHPVTQDRNKIIIEAGLGLGEAIVSGQITPDSYVVDKNSWENEKQVSCQKKSLTREGWIELGEQGANQALTDEEITALARIIKKIETHYGFPVDVEFAVEKDDFFIVQSRPITTLSSENLEKDEVIEKIKNLKWNKVVTRPETPLFRSYTDHSNYFRFEQSTGISWRGPNVMSLKKTIYNRKESADELYEKVRAGYAKDPRFFAKLGARIRGWMEKLLSIANSIAEKDPESMSHEQLREEYRKYDGIAKDTWAFLIVMTALDHVLSENVMAVVRSRISDESKAEEYFKILTFPEIENTHTKEMHSFLKIAAGLKQDNIPLGKIRESMHYENLKNHLDKYRWIGARSFWDTEWTEEDLLQRLEVLLSANPEKEIEYLGSIRQENMGNTKKLLGILKLNDNEKHLVDMAKDFAYLRTYRTDSMYSSGFIARPLFNEIAKRFGITYREFAMMGCFEVLESLEKGKLSVPKEVLRERVEEFATIFIDGETHIFSGKPLARLKNELSHLFEEKKTDIIKGSSAYPGKVTGKVKVLLNNKDVYKVNQGDILVAPMTTPNYIPAMEKAAAFVTDEGGILCHAAIVAREMRKPCVTATDNASRLLEDGDIVEVDADTGVVRIQKSDYTYLWNDQHPLYTLEGNLLSMKNNRDVIWNQIDNVIEVSRKNMFYCYHSNNDLEKDVERGKIFFEKKYPEELFAEIDKRCAEKWRFYNFIYNEDLSRYSDNQLFDLHKKFIFGWTAAIGNFRASQQEGTHYLIEELKKSFTDEELTILMTPTVLDIANNEMIEWKEIVNNEYSEEVILEHARKYPWIVAEHFSYEDIFETLKQRYEFDRKNPNHHDFAAEKRKVRENQKEILKKDPNKEWIASLLQKLAVGRMQLKACWAGIDFYMIKLIHEIAKRTGEPFTDVFKYYLLKDMEDLINGKPISAEEKEKRDRCFVGLWKGGKIVYASGDEAEKIAKEELKELYSVKKTDKIEGMPAHPGKAKGTVRILPTNNVEKARELRQNFKKGEILMTGMTQPNIVDIASRAGAIVTNEGGMLSHAAIIAREFDIPCIVGTLTATQVFKDGDIVEVDANKGVIKIVEEKNEKQNY